jgi:hypothetical protein
VISRSSSKAGPFFTVSLSEDTVIELFDSSTVAASIGMRVLLVPSKPIFTPTYSGLSFSSRNRSSTLPILEPALSYTV